MALEPPSRPRRAFARGGNWWALSVLVVSFGMTACLDRVIDESMAKLTGDTPDRSATLTPEQVLERMAATLQEMDTLSVQVDGFWSAALQGGYTSGTLQVARLGKASWIGEGNSLGPIVESVITDGTPGSLVRWGYYPEDNTYRLRTDTDEDWGLSAEKELTRALPLPGVLFHGGELADSGTWGIMSAIASMMPEVAVSHPPALNFFSTSEALTTPWTTFTPPKCD
ncbi:hypothetical protein IIA16_06475, partial [bacterium]|nr:hypothetical protein [bacterium]